MKKLIQDTEAIRKQNKYGTLSEPGLVPGQSPSQIRNQQPSKEGGDEVKSYDQAFGRVVSLATEAVQHLDLYNDMNKVDKFVSDDPEVAEHLLYEMLGVSIVFDYPNVKEIVEIIEAYNIAEQFNVPDNNLFDQAYSKLQDYAREVVKGAG